jgi:hypothetical protein
MPVSALQRTAVRAQRDYVLVDIEHRGALRFEAPSNRLKPMLGPACCDSLCAPVDHAAPLAAG